MFNPAKFYDIYEDLKKYNLIKNNSFKNAVISIDWDYDTGFGASYKLTISIKNLAKPDGFWKTIFRLHDNNHIEHEQGPWDFILELMYADMLKAIEFKKEEEKKRIDAVNTEKQEFIAAWSSYTLNNHLTPHFWFLKS